ncbi:hypothetical protein [Levilinea saccharolytica]|uniref:hypothetical protein n=1 Tax=Levilinea saccharolytica TaxID=229921 RepID=UPI001364B390|nr:hypothetical protein [Levilinea saccharolytica]
MGSPIVEEGGNGFGQTPHLQIILAKSELHFNKPDFTVLGRSAQFSPRNPNY